MSAPMTATRKPCITRQARDRYSLDVFRFSNEGPAIRAGQLNAVALSDENLHHVARLYCLPGNSPVMRQAQQ